MKEFKSGRMIIALESVKILLQLSFKCRIGLLSLVLVTVLVVLPSCTRAPAPEPIMTPTSPIPAPPSPSSIEPDGVALNPDDVPRVSKEELLQKLESQANIIVVDTRGKQAYDVGHIKGSINIQYSEIKEGRWQPPPNTEVIFY